MILRDYDELHELLKRSGKILCIHGRSYDRFTRLKELIDSLGSRVIHFMDFSPNPKLDEAKRASEIECDVILTIGGGSAIDVSKYAKMNHPESKLIVIPTTAGSGSETIRYAVLYKDGKKLSVTDDNIIPNYVMFDTELLYHMPEYVKKVWCIDGDGAAIMHMGSLAVNGSIKPSNMVHIVINNSSHESVGGLPTCAGKINLAEIARSCGYVYVFSVSDYDELDEALRQAKNSDTLTFIEAKSTIGSRKDLGRPTTTAIENKKAFMNFLNS